MIAQLPAREHALAAKRIQDITASEPAHAAHMLGPSRVASEGMMEDLIRLSTQIHVSSRTLVSQINHRMTCPSPEVSPPASLRCLPIQTRTPTSHTCH